MPIGCETCLKLQKSYSEALRQFTDAMQRQVDFIINGDFEKATASHAAIHQAQQLCVEHRHILERHEVAEHKTKLARV
jgi:hypothetical protein